MSVLSDSDLQHFSLGRGDRGAAMASAADPEVLARAVRAHKLGDAMAQAALTLALMLAIGAVAFVLSVGRASAAGAVIAGGVYDHSALLAGAVLAGAALLVARRAALRFAAVRIRRRRAR